MKWHGKHSYDITTRTIPGFIEMLSQFTRECSLCPKMLVCFRLLDKRRKRCRNEDDEESGFAASLFLVAASLSSCFNVYFTSSSCQQRQPWPWPYHGPSSSCSSIP